MARLSISSIGSLSSKYHNVVQLVVQQCATHVREELWMADVHEASERASTLRVGAHSPRLDVALARRLLATRPPPLIPLVAVTSRSSWPFYPAAVLAVLLGDRRRIAVAQSHLWFAPPDKKQKAVPSGTIEVIGCFGSDPILYLPFKQQPTEVCM